MRSQTFILAAVAALATMSGTNALSPRATDAYRSGTGEVSITEDGSGNGGLTGKTAAIEAEAKKRKSDPKCDATCKKAVDDWEKTEKELAEKFAKALAEKNTTAEKNAAIEAEAKRRKADPKCDAPCKKAVDDWEKNEKLRIKNGGSGNDGSVSGEIRYGLGEVYPGFEVEPTSNGLTEEEYRLILEEIAKYNGKYAKELAEKTAAIEAEAERRRADPNCNAQCKKAVDAWEKNELDNLAKEILAKVVKQNEQAIIDALVKKGVDKKETAGLIDNYLDTIGKAKVKNKNKAASTKEEDSAAVSTNAGAAIVVVSTVFAFLF